MQQVSPAFLALLDSVDRVVAERVEIDLPIYRHNLFPIPSSRALNPYLWSAGRGAGRAVPDGTRSYAGNGSIRATASASTLVFVPDIEGLDAHAGDTLNISMRVMIPADFTAGTINSTLRFSDGTAFTGPPLSSLRTSGWDVWSISATIPPGATSASWDIGSGSGVAYLDAVLVEFTPAPSIGTYFDGDIDETVNLFGNPVMARDLRDFVASSGTRTVNLEVDPTWGPGGLGDHSLSIDSTPATSNATYAALISDQGGRYMGMEPGEQFTISATINVPAPLPGSLHANACCIAAITDAGTFLSPPGPVTGGTMRLALTFTVPTTATVVTIRLYNGSIGGVVRWGRIRVEHGATDGEWLATRAAWDGSRWLSESSVNVAPYIDISDALDSASVNRTIATNVPEAASLITGYTSAQLTLSLSGALVDDELDESHDAYWLFNPHNADSPIYGLDLTGAAIRYWAGLYSHEAMSGDPDDAELVPMFVGTLDSVQTDSRNETVSITALDDRNRLRGETTLPSFAYQRGDSFPTNPGLIAVWCIDYLLRKSGIHSSPPPRDECAFYLGGHGSCWPDVIGFDPAHAMAVQCSVDLFTDNSVIPSLYPDGATSDYLDPTVAQQGPHGPQCLRNPWIFNAPVATDSIDLGGGTFFIEGDVFLDTTQPFANLLEARIGLTNPVTFEHAWLRFTWSPGDATATGTLQVRRGSSTVTKTLSLVLTTGVWHHIALKVVFDGLDGATVTSWLDYSGTPVVDTPIGFPMPTTDYHGTHVEIVWAGWLDSVQITAEQYPVPQQPYLPMAYLDPSLNALYATVETTGQDPWAVFQDLVGAEGGFAGFDEAGVFRFMNRATLRARPETRTTSYDVDLEAFGTESQRSAIATHVRQPTSGWRQSALNVDVYQAQDPIRVRRGGGVYTTILSMSAPVLDPVNPDSGYCTGTHTVGLTQWRASKTRGGSGKVTSGIAVAAQLTSPTQVLLTITNTNSFDVWMVSDSTHSDVTTGSPFLYLGGAVLTALSSPPIADSQWPPVEQGGAVSNAAGDVLLALNANAWMQDLASAQMWSDDMLAELYVPRHIWRNVQIIGDPSMQLADRLHAIDEDIGLDDDALIFGYTFTTSATQWSSALVLRAIAAPGGWVMGVAGRSEMGVTTRA